MSPSTSGVAELAVEDDEDGASEVPADAEEAALAEDAVDAAEDGGASEEAGPGPLVAGVDVASVDVAGVDVAGVEVAEETAAEVASDDGPESDEESGADDTEEVPAALDVMPVELPGALVSPPLLLELLAHAHAA